jgi:hypothetical protein
MCRDFYFCGEGRAEKKKKKAVKNNKKRKGRAL